MMLFVFEGKKTEPSIFRTLEKLYFLQDIEKTVCCFGCNIYELYRLMNDSDFTEDIVSVIKNRLPATQSSPLKNFTDVADFSEVFLFFDYDFQNKNLPPDEINKQLEEMLSFFDDETENGKLYVNYPMVESIKCTDKLPDSNFINYRATRSECHNFKLFVTEKYPFYKSMDFMVIPCDKKTGLLKDISEEKYDFIKNNWKLLCSQHISKANYICTENYTIPEKKDFVNQKKIFLSQLEKYVKPQDSVAILNSFPLFLYEYF